jgi:hypothetical protein
MSATDMHPISRASIELDAVARHWYVRTSAVEKAHLTRCARFRARHVVLGCFSIACTALLGVLSNFNDHVQGPVLPLAHQYLTPLLTVLAPVLTGLVSFLRFDEKSSMHHNAGARFASMKRRLDLVIAECSGFCDVHKAQEELQKICEKWDGLTLQAPALYRKDAELMEASIRKKEEELQEYHRLQTGSELELLRSRVDLTLTTQAERLPRTAAN